MSLLIPTRAITDANANYPQGYHRGNVGGLPAIEPDLIAAYIKLGITMFGIPGTMVQWIYDLFGETGQPAVLSIPVPTIALAVAEDHSGGGHVADKTLTVPVPTIGDAVEVSSLLIEDCEAVTRLNRVYEENFNRSPGHDPPGLWIIPGTLGIHEALLVKLKSKDPADDGKPVRYDYILEPAGVN